MKMITIIGARPQFIKAAVVSRAAADWNRQAGEVRRIEEIIVHTGQHYDRNMSNIFFEEMDIPAPKYNLHIGGGLHGEMTGRMTEALEKIMLAETPDIALVYGDTDSTLAGALAAGKLHIPVAHVEAGLRSFDMNMPEELNRVLTDRMSGWLFCPTETAVDNLQREGFANFPVKIKCVGDVMYDAALFYRDKMPPSDKIRRLAEENPSFYLATVHRAENTDNHSNLCGIMSALEQISEHTAVILPLHPRTKKAIKELQPDLKHVRLIEPVSYSDMLYLQGKCLAVLTDSGGVQKEAFFLKKPCIILRNKTEWPELVEHNYSRLTGASREKILQAERELNGTNQGFDLPLYGNGRAGEEIIKILAEE